MDSSDDEISFVVRHAEPTVDPPGWVDGAPTSGIGQSCAFCGTREVTWVHPLDSDLVTYRAYGDGHTLPSFWALCDPCEELYVSEDDDEAVEVMRSSDWSWADEADVAEGIRQPLAVFRRADLGARRFDPEPPAVVEARRQGFVPLRELTGVAVTLGPLWPSEHSLWLEELGPASGEDRYVDARDRWLVRSPLPGLSTTQAINGLWRWVEREPGPIEPDAWKAKILEFFELTEDEALAFTDSEL